MIRIARESDAGALLKIYAQYIDTPTTFETVLPDEAEFVRRIRTTLEKYPYLVLEEDGRAVGYAYAHLWRERAAYGWDAELSVYLDRDYTGRRMGVRLYGALTDPRREDTANSLSVISTFWATPPILPRAS